jgi:hypothetical protein
MSDYYFFWQKSLQAKGGLDPDDSEFIVELYDSDKENGSGNNDRLSKNAANSNLSAEVQELLRKYATKKK